MVNKSQILHAIGSFVDDLIAGDVEGIPLKSVKKNIIEGNINIEDMACELMGALDYHLEKEIEIRRKLAPEYRDVAAFIETLEEGRAKVGWLSYRDIEVGGLLPTAGEE